MSVTLVSGATGLIGRRLCIDLLREGVPVHALVRDVGRGAARLPGAKLFAWEAGAGAVPAAALEGIDVVVNLAGETIGKRWTDDRRRRLRVSRVDGTRALVEAIRGCASRPRVLVSGSAVGYYGDRGDEAVTEASPAGSGFLADLCRAWEAEAEAAAALGVRVVLLRTAVVLAPGGGALGPMLRLFSAGLGGRVGSGRQWFPWIHLEDEVGLIRHAAAVEDIRGPLNAVAPGEATNAAFTAALGAVLRRPTFMTAPAFALRLALGQMADELLLASQRVRPQRALAAGYAFKHPHLEEALRNVLGP